MQPLSRARSSLAVKLPRLREWRLRRGLSQDELARLSGLSRTTILKLEAGRDAWPKTARKLARALHVKIDELL